MTILSVKNIPRKFVSPVLIQGLVLHPEGVLSEGVKHVVAHRRQRVLDGLEVHHLPRHLFTAAEQPSKQFRQGGNKEADMSDRHSYSVYTYNEQLQYYYGGT